MSLTPNQRFAAAAIVDRLIYQSETTFHADDAQELLGLLPAPRWWERWLTLLPSVSGKISSQEQGFEGASAGGRGLAHVEGGEKAAEFDTRGARVFRAGQWKITLTAGFAPGVSLVELTQFMGDDAEGRVARIEYASGKPVRMDLLGCKTLHLFIVRLEVGAFQSWKVPVFDQRAEPDPYEAGRPRDRGGRAFAV